MDVSWLFLPPFAGSCVHIWTIILDFLSRNDLFLISCCSSPLYDWTWKFLIPNSPGGLFFPYPYVAAPPPQSGTIPVSINRVDLDPYLQRVSSLKYLQLTSNDHWDQQVGGRRGLKSKELLDSRPLKNLMTLDELAIPLLKIPNWNFFSHLTSLTKLWIPLPKNLNLHVLTQLPLLTSLRIHGFCKAPEFEIINKLTQLKSLFCTSKSAGVFVHKGVPTLTSLENLHVSLPKDPPENFGFLSSYKSLQTLTLVGWFNLYLDPHMLPELREFTCIGVDSFEENCLASLALMTKLERLVLYERIFFRRSNPPTEEGWETLSSLTRLRTLGLPFPLPNTAMANGYSRLTNLCCMGFSESQPVGLLSELSMLPQLRHVYLGAPHPDSFPGVSTLTFLESLKIHMFQNRAPPIESICQLTQLKSLYLVSTYQMEPIPTQLSVLTRLQSLETGYEVSSILPSLKQLESLYLPDQTNEEVLYSKSQIPTTLTVLPLRISPGTFCRVVDKSPWNYFSRQVLVGQGSLLNNYPEYPS